MQSLRIASERRCSAGVPAGSDRFPFSGTSDYVVWALAAFPVSHELYVESEEGCLNSTAFLRDNHEPRRLGQMNQAAVRFSLDCNYRTTLSS